MVDQPRIGLTVRSLAPLRAGAWIARFDGVTTAYMTQHSLQKSARLHLVDLHFVGLLAHCCEPNAVLDMDRQNLHALKDIPAGTTLTIDYEATEDELFAPFACGCGAPACRGAIRGRAARGAGMR